MDVTFFAGCTVSGQVDTPTYQGSDIPDQDVDDNENAAPPPPSAPPSNMFTNFTGYENTNFGQLQVIYNLVPIRFLIAPVRRSSDLGFMHMPKRHLSTPVAWVLQEYLKNLAIFAALQHQVGSSKGTVNVMTVRLNSVTVGGCTEFTC